MSIYLFNQSISTSECMHCQSLLITDYCELSSVTIIHSVFFVSLFFQYIFSALISLLSYLNLPLIPRCDLPAPRTPPRDSWDVDGDLSVLQHSNSLSESTSDDPVFLPGPLGLEHSPSSFAHRYNMRTTKVWSYTLFLYTSRFKF